VQCEWAGAELVIGLIFIVFVIGGEFIVYFAGQVFELILVVDLTYFLCII